MGKGYRKDMLKSNFAKAKKLQAEAYAAGQLSQNDAMSFASQLYGTPVLVQASPFKILPEM